MIKNYIFLYFFLINFTASSQYCTNVGPTSNIDSNVESVLLNGVVGSINYTGCPGVVGLQDLTAMGTTLNAGGSYSAQIKFGTCGGNYSGAGTAWIDFNQNGIFESLESIGTWQGIPPVATSIFNFTVPAGAQNGVTRMRITQQEGGAIPLDPCATFAWGSVMDFSITIGNGIDCSGYIGDDMADPIVVSALPYVNTGDNSYCYSNQNTVYASPDVYYQISPSPLMQSISVSLCGSSFDTFLSVVDGAGNIVAFNDDDASCGTQSSLNFTTDGLGIVYIIVEGWGAQMGSYDISITANYLGLNELNSVASVIYPNPTSDHIYLKGIEGLIEIIDIRGNIILSNSNYLGEKIDLNMFDSGFYFVRYSFGQNQFSEKFIIKK